MWSYYGAKTNVIKFYPKPKHDRNIPEEVSDDLPF
jgi:hypothetical protein